MQICQQIAEANSGDINKAYTSLIEQWLPGSEQPVVYSDPNATLEFGETIAHMAEDPDKELVLPIPYMDSSITRLVLIIVRGICTGCIKKVAHHIFLKSIFGRKKLFGNGFFCVVCF